MVRPGKGEKLVLVKLCGVNGRITGTGTQMLLVFVFFNFFFVCHKSAFLDWWVTHQGGHSGTLLRNLRVMRTRARFLDLAPPL